MFEWGPGVKFRYDRMHARAGFVWKGAAHEFAAGPGPRMDSDVVVVHERDQDKDRSQYFPLLEMSHNEDPTDPRYTYYLAREYMYRGEYGPARDLFAGYLKLPTATFDQERSEACRFIAKMVWPKDRERWLLRAAYESPTRRECWADLATHYAESSMPREAAGAAARVLSITAQDGTNSFHLEAAAWDNATFEAMLDIPVPVG
jgi:hypothetical protein